MNENQINIAEYLQPLRNTSQDMVELMRSEFHDSTGCKHGQNAVASTRHMSFRQIHKSDVYTLEVLLFILSIEPKAMPRSMLPSVGSEKLTKAISTLCGSSFQVNVTIAEHLIYTAWHT